MSTRLNKPFQRICLSLLALMFAGALSAQQVSKEEALQKAQAFLNKNASSQQSIRKAPRQAPKLVLANNSSELYTFNDEANGGYVIVSGDERMPDVLGYSYDGYFDDGNTPCNMQAWLEGYSKLTCELQTDGKAKGKLPLKANSSLTPISPMIKCYWGQRSPYNNLCPEIDGEHTLTGCVATAMAIMMFYHQWPKQTMEIIPGYTTRTHGIVVPDIPVTTIDWGNMIKNYSYYGAQYTDEQVNAVATLMKMCGTAVKMDYGLDSSGALLSNSIDALWKYFGYDSLIEDLYSEEYDIDDWNQLVYNELSSGRPVLCGQPGHAFIIDGYDKDGYFHMNFGNGIDGYYLLSQQRVYQIIMGIQPNNPDMPHAYAVLNEGKLTFYYDKEKENRDGEIFHRVTWSPFRDSDMEECEFDPSFADLRLKSLECFFMDCQKLKKITGLNYLNTSEVRTMRQMFGGCSSLETLDLSSFNTENLAFMDEMFQNCSSLTSLDLSNFNTGKVTYMMGMFEGCYNLKSLDLSNFNTNKVTYMYKMFNYCFNLTSLDLSSFNTDNVTDMDYMFVDCSNMTTIYVGERWKIEKVESSNGMFKGCEKLVGGAGTVYDRGHLDKEYAHIDGGPDNPGYFTYKTAPYYTLTYIVDGEVYQTYDIEPGETITPETAPTKEGYTFSGWSEIPETMPAEDVTATGTFTVNKYKLTYMIDGELYLTEEVEYGAEITAPNPPARDGYDFAWSDVPETMPAHDITINGSYTTGIEDLSARKHDAKIFSLEGKLRGKMRKGINIIRYSDGTVRKVFVKDKR